jgi:transcriptional regulator with XRE-family HTH domain
MKQLESERRNPSVEVLYRLVYALNFSIDSLFSNHNDDEKIQELRNKINLCLNLCSEHELNVVYATIEAMLKK